MKIVKYINAVYNELKANMDKLNALDAAIGDGDHGSNVCRGFKSILDEEASFTETSMIGADLNKCASILMAKIGGSSGPLLGICFMNMGMALKDKKEIKNSDFYMALEKGINGIKMLGKSTTGEKTMLDALVPALSAFKEADDKPLAFAKAAQLAQKGAEDTIPMLATKGRASYLGERSIGHQDPGATSIALMFKALANA